MRQTLKYIDRFTGIVFILWLTGLVTFWITAAGREAINDDHITTDAIIVLTGGPDRVNIGLDLLANNHKKQMQGDAPPPQKLFISGVGKKVPLSDILALWPDYDAGTPPCCITLGYEAVDTQSNATEAKNWITSNNIKSIRLVTANYHMPRAILAFQSIDPDLNIIPHPVRSQKEQRNIWRMIRIWTGEYNKTLITAAKAFFQ